MFLFGFMLSLLVLVMFVQILIGKFYFAIWLTVGNSMEPELHNGEPVVYTSPNDIRKGDIVLVREPDSPFGYLVHKVVGVGDRVDKEVYLIKGVNNDVPDGFYDKEDIYAEVHPIF